MQPQPDTHVALRSFSMGCPADVQREISTFYADFCSGKGRGGWRKVGHVIGVSGAYARQLANGERPVTVDIARDWLVNAERIIPIAEVQVCPSCLDNGKIEVHNVADCGGRAVASVVALAPGERVVQAADVSRETFARKQRTYTSYLRPCLSRDPAVRLRQLERLTCAALAEQGEQPHE